MGQIEQDTTQDDHEGSLAPLGLSRSKNINPTEGPWTPIFRKAVAVTFGGVALAAIGGISMAHRSVNAPTIEHLTASVAGAEPIEWLAFSGNPQDELIGHSQRLSATADPSHPRPTGSSSTTNESPPGDVSSTPRKKSAPEPTVTGGILPDGRVVLNLATVTELQTLPGVGKKRAESIIALRLRLGGFRKLSELLRVKGIGVKSLRKLTPKVTLNPPEADPVPTHPSTSAITSALPNAHHP